MMNEAGKTFDEQVLIALRNYIENRPNKLDWLTMSASLTLALLRKGFLR